MNSQQPLVTVSIPAYNTATTLEEAVNSILAQTYKNIEIILTANPSEDNTVELCRKLAAQHKEIVLIEPPERLSPGAARNRGFDIAKGKYIAIMDADDVSFPERLEKEVKFLEENPDIFIVGSGTIEIDDKGRKQKEIPCQYTTHEEIVATLPTTNMFLNSSLLFRNEGYRYREKFRTSQDYDFLLRLLTDGKKFANFSEPLVYYRLSNSSNSIVGSSTAGRNLNRQKIQNYYWERVKTGTDSYDQDTMEDIEKVIASETDKEREWREIRTYIRSGDLPKVRKLSWQFTKKYKSPAGAASFLYSLIPEQLTRLVLNLKKKLW